MSEAWANEARAPYARAERIYREQYLTATGRDLCDIASTLGEVRLDVTHIERELAEAHVEGASPRNAAPEALRRLRIAQQRLAATIAELEEFVR